MIVPIRVMEPPGPRRRIPDLTKEANQNADNLKSLLVYPSLSNFPAELKPIVLPGGHYKLERLKKSKKPQEKVTQLDHQNIGFLPATDQHVVKMQP